MSLINYIIEQRKIANVEIAHLVLPNTQDDPSQNQKNHFCQRTILIFTIKKK
jgi:hypothetical protein